MYSALANNLAQGYLPPLSELQSDNWHKYWVDESFKDFNFLESRISNFLADINQNPNMKLFFDWSVVNLKPFVRDTTMTYKF